MAISSREEKAFRKRYASYLKLLKELNVSNTEEVAALLTVAEIVSSVIERGKDKRVDINVAPT